MTEESDREAERLMLLSDKELEEKLPGANWRSPLVIALGEDVRYCCRFCAFRSVNPNYVGSAEAFNAHMLEKHP